MSKIYLSHKSISELEFEVIMEWHAENHIMTDFIEITVLSISDLSPIQTVMVF